MNSKRLLVVVVVMLVGTGIAIVECMGTEERTDSDASEQDAAERHGHRVACWPPQLDEYSTQLSEDLKLRIVDKPAMQEMGRWQLEVTYDETERIGFNLYLITVLSFGQNDSFLGCLQRFNSDHGQEDGAYGLFDLPAGTRHLAIAFREYAFDKEQWPAERLKRWYAASWHKFSTVLITDTQHYRYTLGPVDTDLSRWLMDCKAQFRPVTDATLVVHWDVDEKQWVSE